MFGLGIGELIIIVIIIIIFVKPEDMPKFFRKVGKLYGELKKYNDDILVKFRNLDQQIKKPLSSITTETNKYNPLPESKNISLVDIPPVGKNNISLIEEISSIKESQHQLKEGKKS